MRQSSIGPARGLAAAVLLGALILGAVMQGSNTPARSAAPVAAAQSPPAAGAFRPSAAQWANLTLATVGASDFAQAVVADGTVATNDTQTTPILSPFSGRIARVFVAAGDRVRSGAPLFSVIGSELVQAHADLRSATASRAAAETALRVAQTVADRQTRLLVGGGAATRDAQQAQVELANARSTFVTADATLAAVRGRLAVLGAPADGGSANGEAVVRAPIAGTVIARAISQGQYVQSVAAGASTPLLTLSDLSRVYLNANLREADAARVHVGDRVQTRVAALSGRVFTGRVEAVGAAVDPASRRVTARATVDNPGGLLRPGMFAEMRLVGTASAEHPAVPENAVVYEGDGAHVWVAHPDRTLEVRAIRAGRVQDGRVEVLGGLRAGEQVVTSGAVFIDRAARPE